MEKYMPILRRTALFEGLTDEDISAVMNCFQMTMRTYRRDDYIFRSGESPREIAILVRGALLIQKDDYWGNRSIISRINEGETFAEASALSGGVLPNDVVALSESTVLFTDVRKVVTVCGNACRFHTLIVQNLIRTMAAKNRTLNRKIDFMARRSIREKLKAYLSAQSQQAGSPAFDIPFNRQQLADYLAVDRSALSAELCRMRDDGLLTFNLNHFVLIQEKRPN